MSENRRIRRFRARKGRRFDRYRGFSWRTLAYSVVGVVLGLAGSSIAYNMTRDNATLSGGIGTNSDGTTVLNWSDVIMIIVFLALFMLFVRYEAGRLIFGVASATVIGLVIMRWIEPSIAGIGTTPTPP